MRPDNNFLRFQIFLWSFVEEWKSENMEQGIEGKCLANNYLLAKNLLFPTYQQFAQFDKDHTNIHNNLYKIIQNYL